MQKEQNLLKGSVLVLLAFFCMAVFGVLTKVATSQGDAIWVSFITYLTGAIVMLPFVIYKGTAFLKTEHFGYHLSRSVFGLTASFLYMLSMQYIPIVNATLLFNTTPIFIPIFATLWLNHHVAKSTWLAIIIGFIGIIVIIKPTSAIFHQSGDLLGLASGISLAVAYLSIKILTPTDSSLRILCYFFFLCTILQLPLLFFAGSPLALHALLWTILAGLVYVSAQVFLVAGYQYADASEVGIYQYTSVIFVGIIDWLIWGVVPTATELIGVLLVCIAGATIIRSKTTG